MAWAFALELTRYRMRSVLAGESEICCGDAIDDQLRRRRSVQSCQTRCSQRSHPLVDVIGPALKTCREMKYLLLVACELTRRRRFAQLIGNFSEVFGSRHHHSCPNAKIPARTMAGSALSAHLASERSTAAGQPPGRHAPPPPRPRAGS